MFLSPKQKAVLKAYLIGLPAGIIVTLIFFAIPVIVSDGEGLLLIVSLYAYGKPTLGLLIAFIIMLPIASRVCLTDLEKGKKLIIASLLFSLRVNAVIWSVFIALVPAFEPMMTIDVVLYFPLMLFLFSVFTSTFTVVLLIVYLIRKFAFVPKNEEWVNP